MRPEPLIIEGIRVVVVDIDKLADYIIDNDDDCNDVDVRTLLDELEEVE